jgi:hypothetical protein
LIIISDDLHNILDFYVVLLESDLEMYEKNIQYEIIKNIFNVKEA